MLDISYVPRLRALTHVRLLLRSARRMSNEITTLAKSVMATAQVTARLHIVFVLIVFFFFMPVFIIFAYITCVRAQIGKLTSAQTDLLDIIKTRRGSDRPRLNGKPRQIRRAAHAYLTIEQ